MSVAAVKPSPLWPEFQYLEHQIVGVEWMLAREAAKGDGPCGGILCDEMGLGKTIQIAGLLKNGAALPHAHNLLIAPVAVLEQWKVVARRAGFSVFVPSPSGLTWQYQSGAAPSSGAVRLYVIGYEKAAARDLLVRSLTWHRCIYDEAHRLSSNNSSTELARKIRARHMWLLTATPIVNATRDIRVLLGLIGLEKVAHISNPAEFGPILKTYILARTMDQLRAAIPAAPPVPEFYSVSLDFVTEEEAEFYRGITGIITRRWKALEHDRSHGAALEKLKLFMRLRQVSLHPQVYIAGRKKALPGLYTRPDWAASSTKFDTIQSLIEGGKACDAVATNATVPAVNKWIIFCHFHEEMDLLAANLRATPSIGAVELYHGAMSAKQKQAALERTTAPLAEGRHMVLLVQLQSGGTGLNLQHFDRIIFSGPWWTQALMNQAVGRAVRIGQRAVVKVYHLHLKEEVALNIDDIIHEKADGKGKLCREVLVGATTRICRDGAEEKLAATEGPKYAEINLVKGLVTPYEPEDSDLDEGEADEDPGMMDADSDLD